jgi:SAM-dependent methyltransferase
MGNIFLNKFKEFLILRESDKIEEKIKDFTDLISGVYSKDTIYDEIVDFLDVIKGTPTRWESFAQYINNRFAVSDFSKVLDVGCGPMADLSLLLIEKGYDVVGIDSKVKEIENLKTIKKLFDYKKEDVSNFDLLVGLEPCDATEHIIRSSMENKIPCVISLCCTSHDSIDGQRFSSKEEWYEYLLSITNFNGTLKDEKILKKTHKIFEIDFK